MFLREELNVLIADSLGYFDVEGTSCSLVGGLNILIADSLGYFGVEGASCSLGEN